MELPGRHPGPTCNLGLHKLPSKPFHGWPLRLERPPLRCFYNWFCMGTSRHSFILWLASLGRLCTMNRLHMAQIECGLHTETHDHLFFHGHYSSSSVWGTINNKANMQLVILPWPASSWNHLLLWASTTYQKKNITHMIARLLLSTMVYFIWQERNNRIFSNCYQPSQTTSEEIY
jgi:hypothetical protein